MPRISAESKVVLATGGTLLIAILMLAALAVSDHRDIRAELRSEAARLDARMLGLETRMDARMQAMEERFDRRLGRLEDRFGRLEERMDRVIEMLARDRSAADSALDDAPASPPKAEDAPVMDAVTSVPGTEFVILASQPSPSAFWTSGSGN